MLKAFVFGKFLPYHKGHEAMIKFALSKCDFLTTLVCCSNNESISPNERAAWIENAFPNKKNIEVRTYCYSETELPNTSVSSKEVSKLWAEVFKAEFPDYSLVITSEEYGNFVAEAMHIQHVPFNISRTLYPVSASSIRNDLFTNWNFLPDSVKPSFAIKVVILGTESTGKTTLTEMLSNHFNCSQVSETARDIIPNSDSFNIQDLYTVINEHNKRIDQAVLGEHPLVVIDTDVFITRSYCRFMFREELTLSKEAYNSSKADLYLYLNNDVEYFQDGTRLSETDRNLLDLSHRQVLSENNICFVEISGNWETRFQTAVETINALIEAKRQI